MEPLGLSVDLEGSYEIPDSAMTATSKLSPGGGWHAAARNARLYFEDDYNELRIGKMITNCLSDILYTVSAPIFILSIKKMKSWLTQLMLEVPVNRTLERTAYYNRMKIQWRFDTSFEYR